MFWLYGGDPPIFLYHSDIQPMECFSTTSLLGQRRRNWRGWWLKDKLKLMPSSSVFVLPPRLLRRLRSLRLLPLAAG